jgi:hypothetical protein
VLGAPPGNPLEEGPQEILTMATTRSRPQSTPASVPPPTAPEEPRFVGVDLHKATAEFHVIDARGQSVQRGQFPVTAEAIIRFTREHLCLSDRVAVEATSNTWAFVRLIRDHVAAVVVSNPLKTRAIAEASIKTDKVDALVLAQVLRCDFLPVVWQPSPAVERSRALAARRTALVGNRDTDREIGASFDRSDGATWGGRRSWRLLF